MTRRAFDLEAALLDDRWIRGLARGLLRDGSQADDALQEARLALLRSPPLRAADPRPWLARVALNLLSKRRREEGRRRQREERAARPERLRSSPGDAIERVELRRELLEAVLALEEPYRSTLVQRFFEEMSLKDIAAAAGVPLGTAKTRLSRALGILRGRLDARHGGAGVWAALLLPFLGPEVEAGLAAGAAGAGGGGPGIATVSIKGGVTGMSVKGMAAAVGISGLLLLGGLTVLHRSLERTPAASPGQRAGSALAAGAAPGESGTPPAPDGAAGQAASPGALEPDAAPAQDPPGMAGGPPPVEPPDEVEELGVPAAPASAEVLALRDAFRVLKEKFGEGGGKGWRAVGQEIGRLQGLILSGPEGFQELLALLDAESDDKFLEALLHHLPLAGTDLRRGILEFQELHQEIWARFAEAEDPSRRAAFLRYFAYDRSLSSSRMQDFLALARSEVDGGVRQVAVDAIASNRELLADTWQVLAQTLEHDPDPECRENAIHGLAYLEQDGAQALVKAAFSSPDERLRAAAIASTAGDRIPEEVTGGDAAAYLIAELRSARTPLYKRAIVKRFVGDPREVFAEELRRSIAAERDMGLQHSYREALQMIEEARAARPQ